MARGKNISVYLIDGVANGKVKAQISNWNGIAYKIPKELLPECKERQRANGWHGNRGKRR